jgi:hypothetical protein
MFTLVSGIRATAASSRAGSRRAKALEWLLPALAFGALFACSGDDQPDPPDSSGGAGSCPSDLPSSAACGDVPSYRLDVAPIVDERCNLCHFPGNSQSEDVFTDHGDIFPQRQTVLTRIYSCVMPPEDAPALTAAERATLLEWLVCGAPDN